jgi:hypothetical protein
MLQYNIRKIDTKHSCDWLFLFLHCGLTIAFAQTNYYKCLLNAVIGLKSYFLRTYITFSGVLT